MRDLTASVREGPTARSLLLVPGVGTSVRALEAALGRAGLEPVVHRNVGRLYVPAGQASQLWSALEGWQLEVDPRLEAQRRAVSQERPANGHAREAIAQVLQQRIEDVLSDFEERGQLDDHQIQAVAAATHPDVTGLCLFDEQGLGKTVTVLFAFNRLRQMDMVSRMLVFAPKSMVLEWATDAERFFAARYKVAVAVGDIQQKRAALDSLADIYVTNFETAGRLQVRLRELLLARGGRAVLVVDESFFVKNASSHRARSVRALRASASRCWVLCGTPAPNRPHDIVEQFNIADGGAAFQGVHIPKEDDAARPVVQSAIDGRGVYLRRLKADALPALPTKAFHKVLIRLQPVQERAYRGALQGLVADLRATDDVGFRKHLTSFMARRTALLQVCSNPVAVLEGYAEVPAKLLALDSILEELVGVRREKVVVWSFFRASLEALYKRYHRYGVVRYDGTVTDARERREVVRRFQGDDATMLFLGNPAAAGAGLTLHRSRYAVYESFSNQAAHYLQSLDRIHRRGQSRPVEYLVLLCDGTIELQEYGRIVQKERAAQELLGDRVVPPITRSSMLEELALATPRTFNRPAMHPAR